MAPGPKERRLARARRDALRGRMGRVRFDRLVRELVELHRVLVPGLIASAFGLEGPLRAAIRADLCLQGWRWLEADLAAREVLAMVHGRLRIQRPSWAEGQSEYVIHGGALIERTRCVECGKPLPPENWKYCSAICAKACHARMHNRRQMDEDRTAEAVSRWI